MIRRLFIVGLIALAAFLFYKQFLAETFEPFFKKYSGKVDFLQNRIPEPKANE